ncbi:ferritin [Methanolapillus millepedarum]|uniref:Bacterial non-heme ferritin n=1 Tax=Methanolapillus millepedarum TaxID=3028296 RepID=A0AA96V6N1_9EURY|nr:Bacterial non-heme ferritin [Methanosarcinaceae archaeon Ac7]
MIKKTVLKELNDQLNRELYAAYLYLGMASKCTEMNRLGYAHWLKEQAEEEIEHAMKFYNYIHDQCEVVELAAVDKPALKGKTLLDFFKQAHEHEKLVTDYINKIMDLSIKEKDYATQVFLQWFITEQIEEEAQTEAIVEALQVCGDDAAALYLLGKHLAKRED